MARKVFFSFDYERDSWRAAKVRNSNVVSRYDKNPYIDKARWESVKQSGDAAIRRWIDEQLRGTSVTVVLIGRNTASRKWVQYEINQSIRLGKGLIGIHIAGITDQNGATENLGPNPLPAGYKTYLWNKNSGPSNLGTWIENAAP
jgi:hypothetical protein